MITKWDWLYLLLVVAGIAALLYLTLGRIGRV